MIFIVNFFKSLRFSNSFTLLLYIAFFNIIVLGFWNEFVSAVKITKLEVPKVIKHGSSVILDCEYEFDEKDQGLVIKWFFNDKHRPIYQWIPETAKRPQDSGVLKGKLNLDYKVNSDKMKMHRALHILRSSADLSGDYTCQVSTFEGEDKQTKKMLVFVPERKFHLKQQRLHDGNLKITCLAEGLYPKPEMSIIHSGKELENTEVFHKENNGLFDIIVTTVIMISDNNSTDEELSCDLKIPDANYTVRKEAVYYLSGSSQCVTVTLPTPIQSTGLAPFGSETTSTLSATGITSPYLPASLSTIPISSTITSPSFLSIGGHQQHPSHQHSHQQIHPQHSQSQCGMNQLGTVYATKRRRRNGKSGKQAPKDGMAKSNPSKRHRERLNAELDTLASLLPFEQNILSKLDRLSILRLSVSYLRTKSYFQVSMHKDHEENGLMGALLHRNGRELSAFDHGTLDGETFLQALNGFLMILTCEGEVFYATHNIEGYLGFHQSDIVHQSVYELVHSEDREELQRQLMWNSFLSADSNNLSLHDVILPENFHLLERSFTVRFRCLLDNTSGFLRLDIRGRIKVLHGQNKKTEDPPLCLFAICTPFGPPSLLELPQKEIMFKSKHKLDLMFVSMDQRGKTMLGYSDNEFANISGYELVHYDDLAYVASAHQELLKTGASGMIAYRLQTKDFQWQWLQTSSRLVYKNSKPDFIISTHRPLMEEEGRDLLGKRTMDFKVSYLDAGLPNSYFTENDNLSNGNSQTIAATSVVTPVSMTLPTTNRVSRKYKPQIRDFLSACRTKRKVTNTNVSTTAVNQSPHQQQQQQQQQQSEHQHQSHHQQQHHSNQLPSSLDSTTVGVPAAAPILNHLTNNVDYLSTESAYNMYGANYHTPSSSSSSVTDQNLAPYMSHHTTNFYQATPALDNRYLTSTSDNIYHQFRPLSSYYSDYHTANSPNPANMNTTYSGNSFLDIQSRNTTCSFSPYDHTSNSSSTYQLAGRIDDKIYACQPIVDSTKYAYIDNSRNYMMPSVPQVSKCIDVSWPYSVSPSSGTIQPIQVCSKLPATVKQENDDLLPKLNEIKQEIHQTHRPDLTHSFHAVASSSLPSTSDSNHSNSSACNNNINITNNNNNNHSSEMTRQTVLMWGSCNNIKSSLSHYSHSPSTTLAATKSQLNLYDNNNVDLCKWNTSNAHHAANEIVQHSIKEEINQNSSSKSSSPNLTNGQTGHQTHQSSRIVMVL